VAATHSNDAWAVNSGFGKCVHLAGPARDVTSLDVTDDDAIVTDLGGAAPAITAGVAAQYLTDHPSATPGTVRAAIIQNATVNKLSGVPRNTPNKLLFNGGTASLVNPATAASFNYSCSGITCTFYGSSSVNAVSSSWSFGDGTSGSGVAVTHTFPQPGNGKGTSHVVTLTITDGVGGTATAVKTVKCAKGLCR